MSVSEKYEELEQLDDLRVEKEKQAFLRKKILRDCGIDENRCDLHKISLSGKQTELIAEAMEKIRPEKWRVPGSIFTKDDIEKKTISREKIRWLKGEKEAHYVKYKGEDGVFRCGELPPSRVILKGKLFSRERRKARKALRTLAEDTTGKRRNLEKNAGKFQEYVLLEYFPKGWNPHRTGLCTFVLFRDGSLFQGEGRRSVNIDGPYIYSGEGSEMRQPLDDWLAENVWRINMGPAGQPKKKEKQ